MQTPINKVKKIIWDGFYAINEKTYEIQGHTLRYMYKSNDSDDLCVVFSAFPKRGELPKYNYVRSLWKGAYDLLYICDDMVNIPTGGSYYIGCDGEYWGIEAVSALIQSIIERTKPTKTVAIGSSKGGTAALLFGLKLNFDYVVVGACQYKIGTYLNCTYHMNSLKKLTGLNEVNAEAIKELDEIVPSVVNDNKVHRDTKIYFHYSTQEHTYEEQIKQLITDLRKNGYQLTEDVETYPRHGDVAQYFPAYLQDRLNQIAATG